jgi:quercetin dioxygenase-like cupin family protein
MSVPMVVTPKSASELRGKVFQLEQKMLEQPQLDLPVKHHFSQGVYARELFIPAGTLLTGKIHKYEQLNILSQGEMSVLTEEGVKRVKAPFHIVAPPGTKRIAYAHTDCTWTTIHQTELRDVEEIEMRFIAQDETEYLEFRKTLELENKS